MRALERLRPRPEGRNAQEIDRRLLWVLVPAAFVVFAATCVLFAGRWNLSRLALCGALALAALCLIFTLANPRRFWWATRMLAGLVCLAYFAAVVRFSQFPGPGSPGPHLPFLFLATVGFMVCGVPALSFLLWGHTRGRLARGDVQNPGFLDRWTARLLPVLAHATWFAVAVYLLSLLVS